MCWPQMSRSPKKMVNKFAILSYLLFGLVLAGATNYQMEPQNYQQLRKLQSLSLDFSQHFQNISLLDLDIPLTRLPSKDDLQCVADMTLWMKGISSGKLWSLKMIDAWGSLPSGLIYMNLIDMGNFGECIKINKEVTADHRIQGKYCFAELPVLQLLGVVSSTMRTSNLKIAVCFPASCSAAHMDALLGKVLQKLTGLELSTDGLVNAKSCQTSEREPLDGVAILTIVLLSIFAGLALLASLYDYFLCPDPKRLPAVIRVFSIRTTSGALFRVNQSNSNPNVIECLNGMRCMSLIWVVFGHEYMFGALAPNVNRSAVYRWIERPFSQMIVHAVFSVDTFFFLSGLLVVMIALRSMERAKGKLNIPLMYLHRYLRLTPLVAMAILAYMKLIPALVTGPLTSQGFDDYAKCERTWYLSLLYVQNYATKDICLGHTWYLAVDMQLYILSPILLFALYKWGKRAAIGTVVLIVLLTVWLFTIMMVNGYSLFQRNKRTATELLYYYTHMHATPWLIGAVFGYFLHANRGKSFKLNRLMVWCGWICALAIIFACEFSLLPYINWDSPKPSQLSDSLYYSLTRIGWPISLCWIVFACMQGFGGMANSFLSSPLWQPLSRLSYSAYIWHLFIQEINSRRFQANTFFSNYEMMLKFWEDFGFTVITAYLMYTIIEAPLGGLESLLLPNRRPNPKSGIPAEATQMSKAQAPQIANKEPLPHPERDLESAPVASSSSTSAVNA